MKHLWVTDRESQRVRELLAPAFGLCKKMCMCSNKKRISNAQLEQEYFGISYLYRKLQQDFQVVLWFSP